jgi:hypothetical protein
VLPAALARWTDHLDKWEASIFHAGSVAGACPVRPRCAAPVAGRTLVANGAGALAGTHNGFRRPVVDEVAELAVARLHGEFQTER